MLHNVGLVALEKIEYKHFFTVMHPRQKEENAEEDYELHCHQEGRQRHSYKHGRYTARYG